MNKTERARKILINRVVLVVFAFLIGFYAIANTVIEPFGKPLEPIAEVIFSGFWMLRTEFLFGGFLLGLFFMWLWFFIYAYLLALVIGSAYKVCR